MTHSLCQSRWAAFMALLQPHSCAEYIQQKQSCGWLLLQVLGLFIVQATAIGCLYFLDPTDVADTRGLQATGIVLMLLNAAYVLAMLIMIAVYGADKTKRFTRTACVFLRDSSQRFLRPTHSLRWASSLAAFKAQSMSFKDSIMEGRDDSGISSSSNSDNAIPTSVSES